MSKKKHPLVESISGKEELDRLNGDLFKTGIPKFDELFTTDKVVSGSIIELMGLPSAGKSMLLYTIMLNILEQTDDLHIMYIDTKRDFQATKLKKMMVARGHTSEQRHREVLKKISVCRLTTAEEVIAALSFIIETPQQHERVKIIIIDSITVLWYLYLGHTLFRLKLMEDVMMLLRNLTDRNITVLVTNIAYHRDNLNGVATASQSTANTEMSSHDSASDDSRPSLDVYQACGQYWEKFADYKVLINFNDYPHRFDSDLETISRQLSLFGARTLAPTIPVNVEITDAGIV